MKARFVAAGMLFISLTFANQLFAETLGYPSVEEASFLLDYPDDWAMVPGENVGDYVSLASPSGVSLQLRTVSGTESAMDQVVAENVQFLEDNFTGVELGEEAKMFRTGVDFVTDDIGILSHVDWVGVAQ